MTEKTYDLVVSLGTDYHHFDRLIQWIDAYLAQHPEITCLVQHGFTAPPQNADAVERLPRADLLNIYRSAKVVVVQGGPGSILDAREVGVIPLAVPRISRLNEVVDDHQIEFSHVMEAHGEAIVVNGLEDLCNKLDAAFADPHSLKGTYRVPGSSKAAENLSDLVQHIDGKKRGDFLRRVRQILVGRASR